MIAAQGSALVTCQALQRNQRKIAMSSNLCPTPNRDAVERTLPLEAADNRADAWCLAFEELCMGVSLIGGGCNMDRLEIHPHLTKRVAGFFLGWEDKWLKK